MPKVDGKGVIKYLKDNNLPIKSIVLSVQDDPRIMEECKCLGADGFIKKDSSLSLLKEGISTVLTGHKFFPFLNSKANQVYTELSKTYGLTKREVEIIRMLKNNQSSHQIADILCISYQTIKTHRKNINHKLHITNVVGLIEFANRYRL
jgi:DNA-binding NarL/FixJ family response regulator